MVAAVRSVVWGSGAERFVLLPDETIRSASTDHPSLTTNHDSGHGHLPDAQLYPGRRSAVDVQQKRVPTGGRDLK